MPVRALSLWVLFAAGWIFPSANALECHRLRGSSEASRNLRRPEMVSLLLKILTSAQTDKGDSVLIGVRSRGFEAGFVEKMSQRLNTEGLKSNDKDFLWRSYFHEIYFYVAALNGIEIEAGRLVTNGEELVFVLNGRT